MKDIAQILAHAKSEPSDTDGIIRGAEEFLARHPAPETDEEKAKLAELMQIYIPLDESRFAAARESAHQEYTRKVEEKERALAEAAEAERKRKAEEAERQRKLAEERRRCGNTYADSASLRPQPGLREWLDSLRARGVTTAVVSSTRTQLIVTALNRMQLLRSFDVVVCGDMVQTPKPAPDSYRLALKWLGLDAGQCLAVEDSPTGLQAAKAAGLQVVGYTGGSIRQDTSRADWTAASFDAIVRLLETLAPNDGRTAK